MSYEAVVVIESDSGYDVAADGSIPDLLVVDVRQASAETAAEWRAAQLNEVDDLPDDSSVKRTVTEVVDQVRERFNVDPAEIDAERQ